MKQGLISLYVYNQILRFDAQLFGGLTNAVRAGAMR
jgi:hypothetical protein